MEKCRSQHYLRIFCKIIPNFKVIVKSIIDPDDNFWRNSKVYTGFFGVLVTGPLAIEPISTVAR